jgi:hypothetical protein
MSAHLYYSSDICGISFAESFSYVDAGCAAAFVSFEFSLKGCLKII